MTRSKLLLSTLPLFLGAAIPEAVAHRGELTVDVDLSARRLVVRADGRQLGAYDISIGKPGRYCLVRATAARTPPANRMWLSLISTASNSPVR